MAGKVAVGVLIALLLLIIVFAFWLVTAVAFGGESYTYRCNYKTVPVLERHMHLWGVPFGSWESSKDIIQVGPCR